MKKYYKNLDLIRVLACIAVLLYHLGLLKGGYLAVCSFFVLSGYLSCVSAFKKEKFDFKNYYKNKFLHLYLPLLIVVLISVFVISFIPNIDWLNLKPETNSVLLGYNNFWQLNANLDYFARHVDSPFMHLWYIAILLQFDLIFPFIFIFFRKIGDKISKKLPVILTFILGIASYAYFYKVSLDNITIAYYNSLSRVFAILFGLSIGFLAYYSKNLVPEKLRKPTASKVTLGLYILIWISLLVFGDANSKYFQIFMILETLVTMRMINYAVLDQGELNKKDKLVKFLADMSYEIYLVQYPVIFIFQDLNMKSYIKIPIVVLIILFISYLLHIALDFKKYEKFTFLKVFLQVFLLMVSLYGLYQYIIAEDHTAEMKALEEQLNQNAKLMKEQQEAYEAKAAEEKEKWEKMMADLEGGEENIKTIVTEMPLAAIGDSVMLGAQINLKNKFKNLYFNAEISRTCYVANDILKQLVKKNALGEVVVFNFGANGDCSEANKEAILKIIGDRKLFWLTVTNDKKVHFNDKIKAFAAKHDNVYIIDWEAISKGHKEYFYSDGLHLPGPGRQAYTDAIYEGIYKVYLDEYNAKKEAIMKQHDEEMKSKISFYGNELLVNAFDYLKTEFESSNFSINKNFNFSEIYSEIEKNIADNSLSYKIVFAFDKSANLTKEEYQKLVDLCVDHEVYIINMSNSMNINNAKNIDFYKEIANNSNYLMVDRIHLTDSGNKALTSKLVETLKTTE